MEQIPVRTELRQGDSPILFDIALEKVKKRKINIRQHKEVNLQGQTIGQAAYMDDLVLLSELQRELCLSH